MNQLTQFLVNSVLNEAESDIVTALFGGGFKPPTKGHLEVVLKAIQENPEIDQVYIIVGSGIRNGISQEQSIKIWEKYKKFIPKTTEIIEAGSPMSWIKNYLKDHSEDKTYILVGAREGNEEDEKDLEQRSKLFQKYGGEIKPIYTVGGVSGTKAREAAKQSKEAFYQFIPDQLLNSDKEEIYNIILPTLNEVGEGSSQPYKWKEDFGDYFFTTDSNVKYEVGLTPIMQDETQGISIEFSARTPEMGGYSSKIEVGRGELFRVMATIINIIKSYIKKDSEVEFILYSPSKKSGEKDINNQRDKLYKAFISKQLPGAKIKDIGTSAVVVHLPKKSQLNENASYSKDIDVKGKILELTKHMLAKGMNITPLPKVIFKNGDSSNARDFYGKTAYYNPNDQTIILYTEGRHPKDLVRSFSHEMIHHIQNIEGRLGEITTTNTQEDDHLNKLEQEANLTGTMTFRNWTDSLNESKQVGVIYHYTTFKNGLKILQSNELKGSDAADSTNANPVYAVSFTRDKRFHNNHNVGFDVSSFGQRPQVRFTVDGNKLSNRYKIGPYAQGGKDGGVFSKGGKAFEAEERVISNKPFSIPIIPYIKSVDILIEYKKPGKDDWDMEYDYETYAPLSAELIKFTQDKNIPINLIVNKNGDPWPDKAKKTIIQKILDWFSINEANLTDTMTFRDGTDSLNEGILPQEKFAQEKNQDYIEQALKILPNKDKYNLKDYTVEILPIDKVKPTQFGEDYINASSKYEAEQYQKYIDDEIEAEDLRHEDFYPIVVDKDTMEILDGNHRHAVHTMLSIPKIKAILVSKKLNESNQPYKYKYGFNDKLGKDPFGLNQYARELAQGLEEELDENRKKKSDPKKGTGKKPEGSDRRLYTDENPKDTIRIKFKTKEDIVDTLNKTSFKTKSHARQSQVINLIHQRVRAAYGKAKDPEVRLRLKRALDYIETRKEASKEKTQRLNKLNEIDISKYIGSWVDTKKLKRPSNFPEAIFLYLKKEGYTNKGEIYRVITLDPLVVIIKQNTEYIDLDKFLEDNQDIEPYDDLYSTYQDEKEVVARLDPNFSFEDIHYASSSGMNMNLFLKNLDKNKLKNDILKKDQGKLLSFTKDRDAANDIFYTSISFLEDDEDLDETKVKEASKEKTKRLNKLKEQQLDKFGGDAAPETKPEMSFEERLKYYKDYYTNVSPSTFDIITEGGIIVIGGLDKSYSANFNDVKDIKQVSINENAPKVKDDGKAIPFGSGYEKVKEEMFQSSKIEKQLRQKYSEVLEKLFLFEKGNYIELNLIKIRPEHKGKGWVTKILDDLSEYAQENNKILTLTPSDTFGASESRLETFYKRFRFVPNKGKNKDFTTRDTMIRPLSEDTSELFTIYLDLDGVITDFDKRFTELAGMSSREYEDFFGTEKFWDFIDNKIGVKFWTGMEWMPEGKKLYDFVKQFDHKLLSAPSKNDASKIGKRIWRKNNTPNTQLILASAVNKKNYADKSNILIDDREKNIQQWRDAGGIGILFKSTDQVINELKNIMNL